MPLSGAISKQKNIDVIANNVANINTPGFKKDQLVFKEYLTAHEKVPDQIDLPRKEWSPEDFYKTGGAQHSFVKIDGKFTNFSQGRLALTKNPLDLAISGKGFFEVLTPIGPRYTRKGSFSINAQRQIVNDSGHPLLFTLSPAPNNPDELLNKLSKSELEKRIAKLPEQVKSISITEDGNIFADNNLIGKVSVVDFKDPHSLKKMGSSYFVNEHLDNLIFNPKNMTIKQGFIEESNVNALHEMSELIKSHRNFENMQRIIKTYDQISGKAVNDITKF